MREPNICGCGEIIPPKMAKCAKCRHADTQERRSKDKRSDKCSDCGTPIPMGDRRHGVRCKYCQYKRDKEKERQKKYGRQLENAHPKRARELKSRW